jgi:Helix-loop-helix DNA-binding domain
MGQGEGADKKKTHNVAERRYRQNINSRIAALCDSVPALRAMSQGNPSSDGESDDAGGLATTHTLNKATVLLGAAEYIRQLERQNRQLTSKCEVQKARLDAIEKLYTAGRIGSFPNGMSYQDSSSGM